MHYLKQKQFIITVSINKPNDFYFEFIKKYIQDFELDNRQLIKEDFLIALSNDELVGFGRIRNRENCYELCSLGVTEPERLKGIGKQLVQSLIKQAKQPLYLVCIIPEYFEPFGFVVVEEYPEAMQEKLNYCTSELVVPEKYVVMKFKND
ncbi:MAG: GNAT family N-acetyltransferase [Bacteroidia bacterium]